MDSFNSTALSRSGASSPSGKLVARIDVPVSEELEHGVIALAALPGIPKAEMVRMILERHVFGELSMVRRMTRIGSFGPSEESPTGGRG